MTFMASHSRHDYAFPHPIGCAIIAVRIGFGPAGRGNIALIWGERAAVTPSGNRALPHCYRESYCQAHENNRKIAYSNEVTPSRAHIAFFQACECGLYNILCARVKALLRYLSCFFVKYQIDRSNFSSNNAVTVFRSFSRYFDFSSHNSALAVTRPEKGGV